MSESLGASQHALECLAEEGGNTCNPVQAAISKPQTFGNAHPTAHSFPRAPLEGACTNTATHLHIHTNSHMHTHTI